LTPLIAAQPPEPNLPRLNGWQRIGIVASVIWAIGAPMYLDHAGEEASVVALVTLPPIVLGWLLAYALVYLRRIRQPQNKPEREVSGRERP
jgi:hypothetical protein